MAKETRIAFRASEKLKERLQAASKQVGLSETTLAEACVEALVSYIETHGGIWLPLKIVPQRTGSLPDVEEAELMVTKTPKEDDEANPLQRKARRSA